MGIEFIITFAVLAFASCGLGNLYLYLIRRGQLLGFMQSVLEWIKPKSTFLYKSLGGCEVCTIQRIADLSFLFMVFLYGFTGAIWERALTWFAIYCLYGGLVFYASALASKSPNITSKKLDI